MSGTLAVVSSRIVVFAVFLKNNNFMISEIDFFVSKKTHILPLISVDRRRLVANLDEMIELVEELFTR